MATTSTMEVAVVYDQRECVKRLPLLLLLHETHISLL